MTSVSDEPAVKKRSIRRGISGVVLYASRVPVLQVCLGVIFGSVFESVPVLVVGLIWCLIAATVREVRRWLWVGVGLILVGVRMMLISSTLPDGHISERNGEDAVVEAVVTDDIVRKSEVTRVVVDVVGVENDGVWDDATGDLLTWIPRYPRVREGDFLRLSGQLVEPTDDVESDFSYKAYLETKGIYSLMYRPQIEYGDGREIGIFRRLIVDSRDALVSKLNRLLPEPHASLLAGILCGVRASMPESFDDALRQTGTTHIIAASGYNVTLVANFIASGLSFVHRRWRIVLSIGGIWLFVLFSGSSLPVVRAGVMVTLAMLALLSGNLSNVHLALPLSAAFMVLISPGVISDISFQLSFVSTAGLIYLVPIFQLALPWVPESVQDATLVTLAAILSTLPLILGTFGSVSVVAPVVNFLVLPVVGIVMAGGLVMVLVPWFLGPVLKLISMLVWVPLEFFVSVVEVFAGIPFASITLDSPLKWIVPVGYTVILLLLLKYYPGSSESILIKDLRV